MPGGLTDTENLVINRWPSFDWHRGEPQRRKKLVGCMKIINHEVKWGITRNYFAFQRKD